MENKSTCYTTSERRLIDANEAYEIARLHHKDFAQSMADLTSLREVLEDCPTVDAVEVVHGYWYKAPHHPYRCSNCGETALLDMYGESHYRSNYCPNCGAKMDGDGNG